MSLPMIEMLEEKVREYEEGSSRAISVFEVSGHYIRTPHISNATCLHVKGGAVWFACLTVLTFWDCGTQALDSSVLT